MQAPTAVLERIEQRRGANAFITVAAEQARAEARAATTQMRSLDRLPSLFGVPFSVKDLVQTAGVPTSSGWRLFSETVPQVDAEAVARLKRAVLS